MFKQFILWDYKRGSWQYDLMVGIILVFIFLTPRDWFRDQPRIPQASRIAMLPCDNGSLCPFYVESGLLAEIPENQRVAKLTQMLQKSTGNRRLTVVRIEPILNSEEELQGYIAVAH